MNFFNVFGSELNVHRSNGEEREPLHHCRRTETPADMMDDHVLQFMTNSGVVQ
jgi:hypothetical protein